MTASLGGRIRPAMIARPPQNGPILTRFRTALSQVYGDRLERVVLYGSRARGDHRPDSDYDILEDTGAVISATPFPVGAYREHTGFMRELRKDGLGLFNAEAVDRRTSASDQ